MFRYSNLLVFGALPLICVAFVSPATAADAPYVTEAVQSPARPPQQMKRDADRKPADLMTFAGIKPGDKVAEIMPEKGYDGYFTMVLSKVVGPQGKVFAFMPLRGFLSIQAMHADERKQRQAGKTPPATSLEAILAIAHTTDYRNVMPIQMLVTTLDGDCESLKQNSTNCFGLPEQADAVVTAAGYHELHNKTPYGPDNPDAPNMVTINKAIFREMKPGGVYVVSDYAAAKGAGFTQSATLNRIEADAVKSEITAAGFTFEAESNILMNDDDLSKPASGDKSARFVLRFRKPASISPETRRYPVNVLANYDGNTSGGPGSARTAFYHADGSYQEFGITGCTPLAPACDDMQIAHTYFDADGHDCMYHESPADQEGYVVCHYWGPENIKAKAGDSWNRPNGRKAQLTKGYVYPTAPPARGQQQQARPAAQ